MSDEDAKLLADLVALLKRAARLGPSSDSKCICLTPADHCPLHGVVWRLLQKRMQAYEKRQGLRPS